MTLCLGEFVLPLQSSLYATLFDQSCSCDNTVVVCTCFHSVKHFRSTLFFVVVVEWGLGPNINVVFFRVLCVFH